MGFSITRRLFGETPDGDVVDAWILSNPEGMLVEVLTLGGIIRRLLAPDANGVLADVVLGYDSLKEYLAGNFYFGAIVGRVAGRLRLEVSSWMVNPTNSQSMMDSIIYTAAFAASLLHKLGGTGFRAVSLDQRGYSRRVRPSAIEAYAIKELISDVLVLADRWLK